MNKEGLNNLTKTFFDTFGIEPNTTGYELKQIKENARGLVKEPINKYPQITDTHYLELIVHLSGVTKPHFVFERGVEELKQDILTQCMDYVEVLKPFVRDMFE